MSDCSTCFYNNADILDNTPRTLCSNPDVPKTRGIPDCPHYKKRYFYRLHDLEVENAKLREECEKRKRDYEWLRARMDEFAESYKRMQENNGRLYELVLYMWDFSCVVPDEPHTHKEELDYSVEVWRRMRELGVEVTE